MWLLVVFLKLFLNVFCDVHCTAGGGSRRLVDMLVINQCLDGWSESKYNQYECQDPRFSSRILHCNSIFNDIHFTCYWFGKRAVFIMCSYTHLSFEDRSWITGIQTFSLLSSCYFPAVSVSNRCSFFCLAL